MKKYTLIALGLLISMFISNKTFASYMHISSFYDQNNKAQIVIGCFKNGYCEYVAIDSKNKTISPPKSLDKLFDNLNLEGGETILGAFINNDSKLYVISSKKPYTSNESAVKYWVSTSKIRGGAISSSKKIKLENPVEGVPNHVNPLFIKLIRQGATAFFYEGLRKYAFLGKNYTSSNGGVDGHIIPISRYWKGLDSFTGGAQDINAVLQLGGSHEYTYFIKNNEVLRYSTHKDKVDNPNGKAEPYTLSQLFAGYFVPQTKKIIVIEDLFTDTRFSDLYLTSPLKLVKSQINFVNTTWTGPNTHETCSEDNCYTATVSAASSKEYVYHPLSLYGRELISNITYGTKMCVKKVSHISNTCISYKYPTYQTRFVILDAKKDGNNIKIYLKRINSSQSGTSGSGYELQPQGTGKLSEFSSFNLAKVTKGSYEDDFIALPINDIE